MTTAKRVAVVGAGIISAQHGLVISELNELELVAVVDPDLEKAQSLAELRGGTAFTSLQEAFAAGPIDIVAVCVPTGKHGEIAVEALEAGAHVVIEKPAEVTVEKAEAILAAQERTGRLVTVISQHRFDPSTEIVLAAIRKGEFGTLTSGIAAIDWWRGQTYYDSGDWRGTWALDGGGALMNQGVHTVDLLIATMGRPVEVFGYTALLAHERIETEDVAVGVVRFESGALGVIHGSTAVYPGLVARLQVHGSRGSAVIENDRLAYFHSTPVGEEVRNVMFGSQGHGLSQLDEVLQDYAGQVEGSSVAGEMSNAHRDQYKNFLAAIRGEEEVRVDIRENIQAIAVITGLYESARTGKPVALHTESVVA